MMFTFNLIYFFISYILIIYLYFKNIFLIFICEYFLLKNLQQRFKLIGVVPKPSPTRGVSEYEMMGFAEDLNSILRGPREFLLLQVGFNERFGTIFLVVFF